MSKQQLLFYLKRGECLACRFGEESGEVFYRWFLLEYYYSGPMLSSLAEGGFCHQHAWELEKRQAIQVSSTFEWLARELSQKLNRLLSETKRRPAQRPPGLCLNPIARIWPFSWLCSIFYRKRSLLRALAFLQRKEPCPVCETIRASSEEAVTLLIKWLHDPEIKAAYDQSGYLCHEHFLLAVKKAPPDLLAYLTERQLRNLAGLIEGLTEYSRKRDYRFAQEPKGEEQLAWLRAIRFFAGEKVRSDGTGAKNPGLDG